MAKRFTSVLHSHLLHGSPASCRNYSSASLAASCRQLQRSYHHLHTSRKCSLVMSIQFSSASRHCSSKTNASLSRNPLKLEQEEVEPEGDTPYVVYDGPLKRQLKHIKVFSLATTMGGLPLQPLIFNNAPEHGMAATIALLSMIGFFTYVTPFLIHQLAKKYVTEISYDPKTRLYTAVTYSFFLMRKELIFSKEDVIVPDVPGLFTSVLVKKKEDIKLVPLFFGLESFIYPNHYGLIMGYDKPLDLHIRPEDIAAAMDKKEAKSKPVS